MALVPPRKHEPPYAHARVDDSSVVRAADPDA